MHEILAIIFWCTDMDSLQREQGPGEADSLAFLTLSRDYVEHDAYTLFNVLMTNMLSWYDPNLSVPSPIVAQSGYNDASSSPLVQPIVAKCNRIHELLKKVDFELWRRMEELKIEPQIYGIRWLRLLFSREFPMQHTYVALSFPMTTNYTNVFGYDSASPCGMQCSLKICTLHYT